MPTTYTKCSVAWEALYEKSEKITNFHQVPKNLRTEGISWNSKGYPRMTRLFPPGLYSSKASPKTGEVFEGSGNGMFQGH